MIGKPPASENWRPSSPGRLGDVWMASPSARSQRAGANDDRLVRPHSIRPKRAWSIIAEERPSSDRLVGRDGAESESAALIRSEMMPGKMKRPILKAAALSASIALVLPAEPGRSG